MERLVESLFWYGVDFAVNMANLLGITYDEFNIVVFVFGLPMALLVLVILNLLKKSSS